MTSLGQTLVRYVISSGSVNGTNLQAGNTYVLLYDGSGTINVAGGVTMMSNAAGRIEFAITNNNNSYFLNITASDSNNHLRNFRLLRIADEFADLDANPFYSGFLDKIEPFATLRFMDWGRTNSSPNTIWSDRTPVTALTYGTESGVPYEVMVKLANQTHQNPWVCVPHLADDNYVTQMSTYFRDSLDPTLTVYLEYSNEVWNWIFAQSHYNADNAPSNLNYARAYAENAKRVFRDRKSVV